jgi:hypothetical protein
MSKQSPAGAPVGNASLIRRGQPGREREHVDAKARVEAYRQRQRDHAEEIMLAQMLPDIQDGTIFLERNPKYYYSDIVTGNDDHLRALGPGERWFADLSFLREELWVGTLFRNRHDKDTSCHATVSSPDLVVEWLRHLHGLTYANKHDNWLISPALFNPTLGETARGKENVILAWGIWLDVDGGDLPYPQLQRMFPGIRMVVYSTWSSTDLTRYRVFLPTEGYMLGETYEAVCGQIVHVVQSKGYCSPRQKKRGSAKPCHGIDLGKTGEHDVPPVSAGAGRSGLLRGLRRRPSRSRLMAQHNVVRSPAHPEGTRRRRSPPADPAGNSPRRTGRAGAQAAAVCGGKDHRRRPRASQQQPLLRRPNLLRAGRRRPSRRLRGGDQFEQCRQAGGPGDGRNQGDNSERAQECLAEATVRGGDAVSNGWLGRGGET